ncbi:response regulator [Chloroflexales bacterium ZM16-3]|nr:response regulator [Chloroflexales bacterium ZM16-3]
MTTHPESPPSPNPAPLPDDDETLARNQRIFGRTFRTLLLLGLPLALLGAISSLWRGQWLIALALLAVALLAVWLGMAARALIAAYRRTLEMTRTVIVARSQALHERDQLLYDIGEAMPDVLIYQTEAWPGKPSRYTYIGGTGGERWGVTLAQAYADPMLIWARIHPEDRLTFHQAIQEANEDRRVLEHELRICMPDGSTRWSFFRSMPQFLPDGRIIRSGIEFDITERKAADLALAEQLRYSEALASCSRTLLVEGANTPDWKHVVAQVLATLRAAVGCTRFALRLYPSPNDILRSGEIIVEDQSPDLPPFQNIPVAVEDVPSVLRDAIARGEPIAGQIDNLLLVGSPAHTHFAANGIRSLLMIPAYVGRIWRGHLSASEQFDRSWNKPTVAMLRTGLEMITAFLWHWEMTSALRAREAQLRALGDNLPNGFIYQMRYNADGQLVFTYLSGGVTSILGVAVEDGLRDTQAIYGRIALAEQARVAIAEQQSIASMSMFAEVVQHILPDGETGWLYLCSRPRLTAEGAAVWDGLAIDITERQRAAEELAQARDAAEAAARAKSAFLASMSHEIRTPLNAVIGMAALLEETPLSDEQRVFVDTISTGGLALLSVINDILDFSRIESGHVELACEPFDVPACLASAVELVAHTARQKGLSISRICEPTVPQIVAGDEGRLRQVLLNLLSNAVKFTERGEVVLQASATAQDDCTALLTVSLRDTGIGMTPEQLERIFTPFVQAEITTARHYGGTGLGLAISQQLIKLMGGGIEVISAPGSGSSFSFSIPLPLASMPAPARSAAPTAIGPLHILVAEDNPVNQEVIRRMLESIGHTVMLVAEGNAAVDAVARHSYDAVLMDVQMPELDGEAATQQIRRLGAKIAQPWIIALTAEALAGDRERFLRAGMDDYLSKPVRPAEIQRALARAAERIASQAQDGTSAQPRASNDLNGQAVGADAAEELIVWAALDDLHTTLGLGEPETTATIIRLFDKVLPTQLEAITAAIEAQHMARLRTTAHRLCGGCLQLGAQAMARLCRRIEHTENMEDGRALEAHLRVCYTQTAALFHQRY